MDFVSIKKRLLKFSRSAWTPFCRHSDCIRNWCHCASDSGYDPIQAYAAMWQGAFKDRTAITEVLIKATP
jgi:ABC-type uncharacterized transport system, permease component